MAHYAIGDVQGCYDPLMALLQQCQFNEKTDTLWFTGDLVNRGPQSLDVLRFVKNLPVTPRVVLGNHDIHLLAVAFGHVTLHKHDTLNDILKAPDRDELLHWLRQQPLMHVNKDLGFMLVHAGLYPLWSVDKAQVLAKEVEALLQCDDHIKLYEHLYGNEPVVWREDLAGFDRLRFIVNAFTRMRFVNSQGELDLQNKGSDITQNDYAPWFDHSELNHQPYQLLFGHWAALQGQCDAPGIHALDTGCIWDGKLTAMRLDDGVLFAV